MSRKEEQKISLKVSEAYTRDVGKSVARIDGSVMNSIGISIGDVIEIRGKKRAFANCFSLYPLDEGKGIIRIDSLTRRNAGVAIGETVTIRKVEALPAERVELVIGGGVPPAVDGRYIAETLEGIPLAVGNEVTVPFFASTLVFKVKEISPKAEVVISTSSTSYSIKEKKRGRYDEMKVLRFRWLKDMVLLTGAEKKLTKFHILEYNEISSKENEIIAKAKELAKTEGKPIEIFVEFYEKNQGLIERFEWAKVEPDGTIEYTYPIDEFPIRERSK